MRTLLITGMGLALLAMAGCGSIIVDLKADHALKKADKYLSQQDYTKAQEQYAKALSLRPTGAAAFKSAYCLKKTGDDQGASQALATACDMGVSEAQVVLAADGGVSTDDLREFVRDHQDDAFAWAALAERCFSQREYDQAIVAYEQALVCCKDPELSKTLSYNLSIAHLKAGRYADAEGQFGAYMAKSGDPLTDEERFTLGVIRYSQGDTAGAARVWAGLPTDARHALAQRLGDESTEIAALAN